MLDAFPGGLNLAGMQANTDWLAANPDAARAFLRAYAKAAKWGNANPDQLKEIIAKYAGVEYEAIKDIIPSEHSEDGQFLPGFLNDLQDVLIRHQMIPGLTEPLDESEFIDLSYLP
jgi:ABC-type nitrate/sulfonate/bicarbonate transport system substrate-binding protein